MKFISNLKVSLLIIYLINEPLLHTFKIEVCVIRVECQHINARINYINYIYLFGTDFF